MGKRWRIQPHDSHRVALLERQAGIPAVVAQLLVSRGVHDSSAVQRFLDPRLSNLREPDDLPGLPEAAERMEHGVAEVIRKGERVTYDLKPTRDDPTAVGTSEFADAVIERCAQAPAG